MKDFSHRNHDRKRVYNSLEATTINDVARNVLRIYAGVENPQEDHQYSMVQLEGKITK